MAKAPKTTTKDAKNTPVPAPAPALLPEPMPEAVAELEPPTERVLAATEIAPTQSNNADSLIFELKLSVSQKNPMFKNMKTAKKRYSVFSMLCINEVLGNLPSKHQQFLAIDDKLVEDGDNWTLRVTALSPNASEKSARAAKILACLYSIAEVFRLSRDATYNLTISYSNKKD